MFGLIAQNNSAATAGTENALNAALDPDITQQNSQYIFTGLYSLLAELAVGASVQFGRYNVAEWNGRGRPNIFAVNRAATPTSPIFFDQYVKPPLPLPMNQQIQALLTNNLGSGTEAETLLWKIATPDWSQNEPSGMYDFIGHATATLTPVANAWSLSNVITFDVLPLGGVYAVLGARCIGANAIAFRLNFPRTRMYLGRRLRPGDVMLSTFGALPPLFYRSELNSDGVWGFFHTFELPTLDVFGQTASSTTYHLFLKLRFLGQQMNLLDQAVMSNY